MGNFQSNSLNRNVRTRISSRNKKTQTYEIRIEKYKQDIPKLIGEDYMRFKGILYNDLKLLEKEEKYTENSKRKIRTEYQKLFHELATQEEIANRPVKFNRTDKTRDSKRKLGVIEKKITIFENQIKMVNTNEKADKLREEIMKCKQSLNQNINKTKQHEKLLKRFDVLLNNLGLIVGESSTFYQDNRPAKESRPSTVNTESVPLEKNGQELIQGKKLSNSNQIKVGIPAPKPDLIKPLKMVQTPAKKEITVDHEVQSRPRSATLIDSVNKNELQNFDGNRRSSDHPNFLQEKRSLGKKIPEQNKKIDQMKMLPVPENKIETVRGSKSKIPNKSSEMTDPLMYIEKKLTEFEKQLDNFDGDRKSLEFLYLDQNFLKVMQDIKNAECSDNNRKRLYRIRVKNMRQLLFKKIDEVDADYEKKVYLRFEKIMKELTAMDVELICSMDKAKRTYVENILTDFIREIDDVDTEEHPNLLQEKRSLVTKILEQQKKLDQIKMLQVTNKKKFNENLDNEKINYLQSQLAEDKVLVNDVNVTSSPNVHNYV